jgi:hypothetical protein
MSCVEANNAETSSIQTAVSRVVQGRASAYFAASALNRPVGRRTGKRSPLYRVGGSQAWATPEGVTQRDVPREGCSLHGRHPIRSGSVRKEYEGGKRRRLQVPVQTEPHATRFALYALYVYSGTPEEDASEEPASCGGRQRQDTGEDGPTWWALPVRCAGVSRATRLRSRSITTVCMRDIWADAPIGQDIRLRHNTKRP